MFNLGTSTTNTSALGRPARPPGVTKEGNPCPNQAKKGGLTLRPIYFILN